MEEPVWCEKGTEFCSWNPLGGHQLLCVSRWGRLCPQHLATCRSLVSSAAAVSGQGWKPEHSDMEETGEGELEQGTEQTTGILQQRGADE